MSRLSAVIFDMDGTLLDTGRTVPRAYIATVAELTGRVASPEDVYRVWNAGTVEATLSALIDRPANAGDVEVYQRHLAAAMTELRPYPGIDEAVPALAARVPAAVVTGASRRVADLSLAHTGLSQHLQFVIGGDEVHLPKPNPEGILAACSRLGVEPATVAYVGDARTDLMAAKRAGALAVAVAWGHAYDRTAPADVTVNSPDELVDLLLGEVSERS